MAVSNPARRADFAIPPRLDTLPGMLARLWPHIRALIIAVHVFAVAAMAFPSPSGGMNRRAWSNPTVQAEFSAWADRLTAMGRPTTTAELEEHLWGWAQGYMANRNAIIKPFRPYYRYCGTDQSWKMFVAPHRNPARLHVEIRDAESLAWRPVYVARSREHDWMADALNVERFRAALFRYAWKQYRGSYRQFARWLGRHAATDFPGADRLRTSWERIHTLHPKKIRAGASQTGELEMTQTVNLDDIRKDGEAL